MDWTSEELDKALVYLLRHLGCYAGSFDVIADQVVIATLAFMEERPILVKYPIENLIAAYRAIPDNASDENEHKMMFMENLCNPIE